MSLADDAREIVPQITKLRDRVTIGHHSSGLRDFHVAMWLGGWHDCHTPIERDEILEFVSRQQDLNFSPGTEHASSNTGYTLLAEAVARPAGQTFEKWSKKNLFEPLEM